MKLRKLLILPLVVLFAVVLVRNAWVTDDAYITFRTIDNFVNGYGLVWNVAERVQAYTHPLWMFLMTLLYLLTGEVFFTVIIASVALTVAAASLLAFKIARTSVAAVVALLILMLSKAFVDYSVSGLENPLTHLLLVLFAYFYFKKDMSVKLLLLLSFLSALAACNRLDTLVFFVPALAYGAWRLRSPKALLAIVVGFIPLLLWEIFSLFYYGFLFPNTYYAKLHTGIAKADLVHQGLYYFADSFKMDPLTLVIIAGGIIVPVILRERRHRPLVIGVLLYLIYTLYIGGDFMSGRFFATPLLMSVILLADGRVLLRARKAAVAFCVVLVIGLLSGRSPAYTSASYGDEAEYETIVTRQHGITDERGHYFQSSGLLNYKSNTLTPDHRYVYHGLKLRQWGSATVVRSAIGYMGYFSGPKVHIIDVMALCDPLLARLPVPNPKNWRIGHFRRELPIGYTQTVRSGQNLLKDLGLQEYYEKLRLITCGDLLGFERLKETVRFNMGSYDHLIDDYDSSPLPSITLTELRAQFGQQEDNGGQAALVELTQGGADLNLEQLSHARQLTMGLDKNHDYVVVLMKSDVEMATVVLVADTSQPSEMITHSGAIPPEVSTNGFDRLTIYSIDGSDGCFLDSFALIP